MNVGAQEVIKQILARRSVTKLILVQNDLGDLGCEELFGVLSSDTGRKYKVAQISLNSNNIGNRGLLAISRYLRDNTALRELYLQSVSPPFFTKIMAVYLEKECWVVLDRWRDSWMNVGYGRKYCCMPEASAIFVGDLDCHARLHLVTIG